VKFERFELVNSSVIGLFVMPFADLDLPSMNNTKG
jgi:hypothetical protein